jgi:hypothetical protein
MFKYCSVENELMEELDKKLIANHVENTHGFNKLAKAIDYVNNATEILSTAGISPDIIKRLENLLQDVSDHADKILPKSDWEDELTGGLADDKTPKDFDKKDLEKGIKVEMEHTNDKHIATEIAMDHLTEDSEYYDKLEELEGDKHD